MQAPAVSICLTWNTLREPNSMQSLCSEVGKLYFRLLSKRNKFRSEILKASLGRIEQMEIPRIWCRIINWIDQGQEFSSQWILASDLGDYKPTLAISEGLNYNFEIKKSAAVIGFELATGKWHLSTKAKSSAIILTVIRLLRIDSRLVLRLNVHDLFCDPMGLPPTQPEIIAGEYIEGNPSIPGIGPHWETTEPSRPKWKKAVSDTRSLASGLSKTQKVELRKKRAEEITKDIKLENEAAKMWKPEYKPGLDLSDGSGFRNLEERCEAASASIQQLEVVPVKSVEVFSPPDVQQQDQIQSVEVVSPPDTKHIDDSDDCYSWVLKYRFRSLAPRRTGTTKTPAAMTIFSPSEGKPGSFKSEYARIARSEILWAAVGSNNWKFRLDPYTITYQDILDGDWSKYGLHCIRVNGKLRKNGDMHGTKDSPDIRI